MSSRQAELPFLSGFIFGLLLQIAVGPVFLYVLNTALNESLAVALSAVAAVAFVDALCIVLALAGVAAALRKKRHSFVFRIVGSAVLLVFALNMIASAWGVTLSSDLLAFTKPGDTVHAFWYAFVLTASNPLTIVFWSGVFSSKASQKNYERGSLLLFGGGAVMSTVIFLSGASLLGTVVSSHLSGSFVRVSNVIVGLALGFFAIRSFFKKD